MSKPSLFRLKDVLAFMLPALIITILGTYAAITGVEVEGTSPIVAIGLIYAVAAVMWVIYGILVFSRWKYYNKIDFVTKHGWFVVTNGCNIKKEDIENEVDETIALWKSKAMWVDEIWDKANREINKDWWLFCEPGKIEHERLGSLAGYVTGDNIVIGFVGVRPIQRTALAHEVGHILHKAYWGLLDNREAHNFITNNDLP
jgi:hypothetical protein